MQPKNLKIYKYFIWPDKFKVKQMSSQMHRRFCKDAILDDLTKTDLLSRKKKTAGKKCYLG